MQISLTEAERRMLGAEAARTGALGRRWLQSHHRIDGADLAIAATALHIDARLLTLNVRHFPMMVDLRAPYRLS